MPAPEPQTLQQLQDYIASFITTNGAGEISGADVREILLNLTVNYPHLQENAATTAEVEAGAVAEVRLFSPEQLSVGVNRLARRIIDTDGDTYFHVEASPDADRLIGFASGAQMFSLSRFGGTGQPSGQIGDPSLGPAYTLAQGLMEIKPRNVAVIQARDNDPGLVVSMGDVLQAVNQTRLLVDDGAARIEAKASELLLGSPVGFGNETRIVIDDTSGVATFHGSVSFSDLVQDNAQERLLTADATTGRIRFRTASSIGGGGGSGLSIQDTDGDTRITTDATGSDSDIISMFSQSQQFFTGSVDTSGNLRVIIGNPTSQVGSAQINIDDDADLAQVVGGTVEIGNPAQRIQVVTAANSVYFNEFEYLQSGSSSTARFRIQDDRFNFIGVNRDDALTRVLVLNGSDEMLWRDASTLGGGGGASVFNDLTDVDFTTTPPASGDFVTYDGTNWVPVSPVDVFDISNLTAADQTNLVDDANYNTSNEYTGPAIVGQIDEGVEWWPASSRYYYKLVGTTWHRIAKPYDGGVGRALADSTAAAVEYQGGESWFMRVDAPGTDLTFGAYEFGGNQEAYLNLRFDGSQVIGIDHNRNNPSVNLINFNYRTNHNAISFQLKTDATDEGNTSKAVFISGAGTNHELQYGTIVLDTLGGNVADVDLSTPPIDGQTLTWDAASSTWLPATISGGATSIDGLSDAYSDGGEILVIGNDAVSGSSLETGSRSRVVAVGGFAGNNWQNNLSTQTVLETALFGFFAGNGMSDGYRCTAIGSSAMNGADGNNVVAIGWEAGSGFTGTDSVLIGSRAGRNETISNLCAIESGANLFYRVELGATNRVALPLLPGFADEAAATTGGLVQGDLYYNTTGSHVDQVR